MSHLKKDWVWVVYGSCKLAVGIEIYYEKLLVLLQDGKKLLEVLRSFDQYATINVSHSNVVLKRAFERVIVGDLYCDISLGLYVIRGENVILIGELSFPHMIWVSEVEIKSKSSRQKNNFIRFMKSRIKGSNKL
ncbi:hypothetical protein NMG60_11025678 [Bertholletia excelsa]